jgi:methylenetetrahydrofolate dehydrogenase (NADP+) / methenyltetrahydrofolate cyclohydrolase
MSAQIIDGKIVAESVKETLRPRIAVLKQAGVVPGLAAVLVGDDPASNTYVTGKAKMCAELGMYSEVIRKPGDLAQTELVSLVRELNSNPKIHGILVQSPLPRHLNELAVTLNIDPRKDVDGFHPYNVGMMLLGHGGLLSCTPYGIIKLLEYYQISPSGKEVVIVGRSNIVGKPMAALLVQKGKWADATVTVAHSRSANLPEITRRADILIAAIGKPRVITEEMVKPGVVIIDVGINRIEDSTSPKGFRLVGDVDFAACAAKASFITPVPGGVGLMTKAMLMANTVAAAEDFHTHS